jgi:methyltransferase family protein
MQPSVRPASATIRSGIKWLYVRVYEPVKAALFPHALRMAPPGVTVILSYRERRALHRYARTIRGGLAVEIGCYNGGGTYFLAKGAAESGGRVASIDPFLDDLPAQRARDDDHFACMAQFDRYYAGKKREEEVYAFLRRQRLSNVDLVKGYSHDVVKTWRNGIRLLFIDGNHEYHAVRQDFEDWSPFVELGGYVLFHDSTPASLHPGPVRVASEIASGHGPSRGKFKFIEAVDLLTVFRRRA